jgi:hypothetical protein
MYEKNISCLLGSGFSIPYGIPSVSQINKRLIELKENDFTIHTSQLIYWNKGGKRSDYEEMTNRHERHFVVDFIAFYQEYTNPNPFDYESFYDFYWYAIRHLHGRKLKEEEIKIAKDIVQFCEEHNNNPEFHTIDPLNKLLDFDRDLNQIISSFLTDNRLCEDVSQLNMYEYSSIISVIHELLQKKTKVCMHSLNHDLLFEFIARNAFSSRYKDGFSEVNSPFYSYVNCKIGNITKRYKVTLPLFNADFDAQIPLIKLHGSKQNHIVLYTKKSGTRVLDEEEVVKCDYGIDINYISMEEDGKTLPVITKVAPYFLSGTTTKMLNYETPYYKTLFNQFRTNLQSSQKLLVIGYGFSDIGINQIIIDNLKAKKIVVVDPYISLNKISAALKNEFEITLVDSSIDSVNENDLVKILVE